MNSMVYDLLLPNILMVYITMYVVLMKVIHPFFHTLLENLEEFQIMEKGYSKINL